MALGENGIGEQGCQEWRKLKLGAIAFALIACALLVGGAVLANIAWSANSGSLSPGVIEKVVDAPSDYGIHMSEPDDTSEIGRIKTDKTVRAVGFDAIDRNTGQPITPEEIGDNFTVTFSALSSGGTIAGQSSVPVDVVLVLDTSLSMNNASGTESRAAAMVDAVNETIAEIMAMNPENRVAVQSFGVGSATVIPLQSLPQVAGN